MSETPTAWLEARFDVVVGRTRMAHCFAQSPLKIAKTFARENGVDVCVMDCSPGMLAGDWYSTSWHLEQNARVTVSTQGFSRVHPSRARPCKLQQRFELESGSWLEHFPEPLMLYQNAAVRIESDIEMSQSATLLMGEIVCAGRIARGEAFAFHALQNRLRARCEGHLIYANQTGLRPADFGARRVGAWGTFTHAGTFLIFSARADEELQERLQAVLDEHAPLWGGVSRMERFGLTVGLLGHRACDLQQLLSQLCGAAREHLRS